jgi:c-di-GMP-binding flagellar brake protein YcgR
LITNLDQIANEVTAADRRREKRVNLTFSIAISTFSRDADLIAERTRTIDISENGCRFATRLPLERGNVLAIALVGLDEKTIAQEKSRRFEVMWTAEHSNVRIVGARQTDGDTLWNVSFPTTERSPNNSHK